MLKIIVGLGNYGQKYFQTRHNTGFIIVNNLAYCLNRDFSQDQLIGADLDQIDYKEKKELFSQSKRNQGFIYKHSQRLLLKPLTYMNRSGQAVRSVLDYYWSKKVRANEDLRDLIVIHDDLDLNLGEYKVQYGTGPRQHNGLLSIYQHLNTKNFWHIRVGIDTRQGNRRTPPPNYVLQKMNQDEMKIIDQVSLKIIKLVLEKF